METLAPSLQLLFCIKKNLERGLPVKNGVEAYLESYELSWDFPVTRWYYLLQQGHSMHQFYKEINSIYRRSLLQILERGWRGESIYSQICQLEIELIEVSHAEITSFIQKLPFLMLIPLMFFQFPALLLLLFGPLLQNLFHSFSVQ